MKNDLVAALPESDPDKDALIDYGLTAVAYVAVVGSGIADLARGSSREKQRSANTNSTPWSRWKRHVLPSR